MTFMRIVGWGEYLNDGLWRARPATQPLPPDATRFLLWDALAQRYVGTLACGDGTRRHVGPQDSAPSLSATPFIVDGQSICVLLGGPADWPFHSDWPLHSDWPFHSDCPVRICTL